MKTRIIALSLLAGTILLGFLFLNNYLSASTNAEARLPLNEVVTADTEIGLLLNETGLAGNKTCSSAIPTIFSGRGGCCGSYQEVDTVEPLAMAALEFYKQNYEQLENLTAEVEEYGCHQEISILSEGKEIHRFSHAAGSFYDLAVRSN